jgi:predicted Zn-dependent protease
MPKERQKKAFCCNARRLAPDEGSTDDVYQLQALMGRHGYLKGGYRPGIYDEATRKAVAQFQSFYRLYPSEDGICDQATIYLLNQPRCGMPDHPPGQRSTTGRLAPFVTVGSKWPKASLSYRFLNATPDLTGSRQRQIIQEAFSRWSSVCALSFLEVVVNDTSDLSIAFLRDSHGDGYPFDDAGGPDGNTLAHAFFPPPDGGPWAGSLHFDEFENWKDQPGGVGTRLYNVSLHEIGHLLGLAHSQDQNAIMYAYYAEDRNDLRADDIAGIQSLYGSPATAPVAIAPGERVSGQLSGTNAEFRYQVTVQNKVLVKLDGPEGQDFDLYVRYAQPVGKESGQYDFVSYGVTADEVVTITDPNPGIYYILVQSYQGAGTYNLEVELA